MHFSQIGAFALAAASATHASPVVSRVQDRPDEAVFMVNCDRFEGARNTPKGVRDQFLYFDNLDNAVNLINNPGTSHFFSAATARSVIGDKGQHDSKLSHIDWTLAKEGSPLSAQFPQGNFQVWGLAGKGDTKTNITGVAKLGTRDFTCYDSPKFKITDQEKGPNQVVHQCETKHFCTRSERLVRRTRFNVFDTTVTVPIIGGNGKDPRILEFIQSAFGQLENAVADNAGDTHPYPIKSSDFNIYFEIERHEGPGDARYDANRIKAITKHLTDKLATELHKNQLIRNCRGMIIGLEPTCEHQIAWPAKILVQVEFATQSLQAWTGQDTITIRVAKDPAKMDASCKKDGALAKTLGLLFSVGSAYSSGLSSAVVAGLGAVVGIPSNGNC